MRSGVRKEYHWGHTQWNALSYLKELPKWENSKKQCMRYVNNCYQWQPWLKQTEKKVHTGLNCPYIQHFWLEIHYKGLLSRPCTVKLNTEIAITGCDSFPNFVIFLFIFTPSSFKEIYIYSHLSVNIVNLPSFIWQ